MHEDRQYDEVASEAMRSHGILLSILGPDLFERDRAAVLLPERVEGRLESRVQGCGEEDRVPRAERELAPEDERGLTLQKERAIVRGDVVGLRRSGALGVVERKPVWQLDGDLVKDGVARRGLERGPLFSFV
jgi:hypothetical protein